MKIEKGNKKIKIKYSSMFATLILPPPLQGFYFKETYFSFSYHLILPILSFSIILQLL